MICMLSCNSAKDKNKEEAKTDTSGGNGKVNDGGNGGNTTITDPVGQGYAYEPAVSYITGTIAMEAFNGPTNKKENVWVVNLPKGINILAPKTADGPESKYNVSKIQLIPAEGVKLDGFKGKSTNLKGTFFEPHTGHHFTQVMMVVKTIE